MKRLIQFNELVFNSYVTLDNQPELDIGFKTSNTELVGSHGDYSPESSIVRHVSSQTFSVTLYVDKMRFRCDDRETVQQFVIDNLAKLGRLWAVDNDTVLWAFAKVISISEFFEKNTGSHGLLGFNVTFYLPEGLWNLADNKQTYICDYEYCDIDECYEILDRDICNCCSGFLGIKAKLRTCPDCCEGVAICNIKKGKLASVIGNCGNNKRIQYSCVESSDSICFIVKKSKSLIIEEFYGHTLYPTDDVTIVINGAFKDLSISINSNKNIIKGSYSGEITLKNRIISKFVAKKDIFDEPENIKYDSSNWIVPDNMMSGWTIKKGKNLLEIHGFEVGEEQNVNVFIGGKSL